MCECDESLSKLIQETIQYLPSSQEYKINFTEIMLKMEKSGKILNRRSDLDIDIYHDALLKSWEWLRRDLPRYDSEIGCIFAWFNTYLNYRIKDGIIKPKLPIVDSFIDHTTGERINPIDIIPAPPTSPSILEEIQEWIEDNQAKLRRLHTRDRWEGNCYNLLLERLPPLIQSWPELETQLNIRASTLCKHYKTHCLPLLEKWMKEQGYLS